MNTGLKIFLITVFFIFTFQEILIADQTNQSYTIAFITDTSGELYSSEIQILKEEIEDLVGAEFKIEFNTSSKFAGNLTEESVKNALKNALDDPQVDMIITVGPLSSYLSKSFFPLKKPVLASFVINYKLQNFPSQNGTSGVDNFTYVTLPPTIINDYRIFKEMVPHDHGTILVDKFLIDANLDFAEQAKAFSDELGITFDLVPVNNSAPEVLNKIPKNAEAVYLMSISSLPENEKKKLFDGLIQLDLPSFSYYGKKDVELGALATTSPEIDFSRFARRIALDVQRHLLGENLSSLPTIIDIQNHLLLNQQTIWSLNLNLPWKFLQDAEILGASEESPFDQISLTDAVLIGTEQNVNLAAAKQEIYIGYQDLKRAYSYLFPQIEISSIGRAIDLPTAYVSGGFEPQRTIFGRANISQAIYSNEKFGQVNVEKWLQAARCDKYRTDRLDLVFEIARTYLEILRVSGIENIQRNNLRITRTNLKVAQQRVNVGQARYSEIFRWESEIAKKRANLIVSHFEVQKNKVHLNKLLNRPIGDSINLQDLSKNLDHFILTPDLFGKYITSDKQLEQIARISILEGYHRSPELKEIQDQIYAQSVLLGITRRAFYVPEVSLNCEFNDRWWEEGAGTIGPAHTGGDSWFVGINVRFPLYTGGRITANNLQAFEKLKQLIYIKDNILLTIDSKIREYYLSASAAFGVLKNARIATKAAADNMELVYQSYVKGKNTIIDVLDAQNQLLISEIDETNAIYDFFISMIGVQREMGNYDFLLTQTERSNVRSHLDNIFLLKANQ